uniref:Uncharacterized protein n=1 Tax=Romanomermis culicivorax TaxID=13658 RepID=A0A915KYZ7_ROMCU
MNSSTLISLGFDDQLSVRKGTRLGIPPTYCRRCDPSKIQLQKYHQGHIPDGLGCATAGCIGGSTTTTTAADCVAAVSKAGCFALTTSPGPCSCTLTCPDPPACAVWEVEARFNGTLEINSLAG